MNALGWLIIWTASALGILALYLREAWLRHRAERQLFKTTVDLGLERSRNQARRSITRAIGEKMHGVNVQATPWAAVAIAYELADIARLEGFTIDEVGSYHETPALMTENEPHAIEGGPARP